MAIEVKDLPPKYQAQAMKKYMEQQARRGTAPAAMAAPEKPKETKYHNKPTERDFTLQEAYTDPEGNRVRAIRYKADFTYYQPPNRQMYGSHAPWYADQSGLSWEFVVEDVKSRATKTQKYAIKKKLLKERFGIDITEV